MGDMLFDFLGKFGLFLALGKNLVTGVKDRCVVTAAKGFANAGQGKIGQGPSQIHTNLAGQGDIGCPFLGKQVIQGDVVIRCNVLLDGFNGNSP